MRTVLSLLLGFAESAFGLLVVAAFLYPPLLGYYSVACGTGGAGWALSSLVLLPLVLPPLGMLWFATGVALGVLARPFHAGTSFWSLAKWLPVAALVCGVAAWAFATVADATARCSFGF